MVREGPDCGGGWWLLCSGLRDSSVKVLGLDPEDQLRNLALQGKAGTGARADLCPMDQLKREAAPQRALSLCCS